MKTFGRQKGSAAAFETRALARVSNGRGKAKHRIQMVSPIAVAVGDDEDA
jgi:hypothetical protein